MIEGLGDGLAGNLEQELSSVLVGRLNLADAVLSSRDGDVLVVKVSRPALIPSGRSSHNVIGSPAASIAAAMAAQSLGRPASAISKNLVDRWLVMEIELQPAVQM